MPTLPFPSSVISPNCGHMGGQEKGIPSKTLPQAKLGLECHYDGMDVRGSFKTEMMEHKRGPVSLEHSSMASLTPKRHKAEMSLSSKEKKEKFGERIAALQQLVSPFGKTDTASVLLEAMEYINFLHEQVKVLSAPYLHSMTASNIQESHPYSLRGKGLCLVPLSYTNGVASSNGADIWAPVKSLPKC